MLLKISFKAMNHIIGENSLVPSLLVFGETPRLRIVSTKLPKQKERMEAIAKAQMEINFIREDKNVEVALQKRIPKYFDYLF